MQREYKANEILGVRENATREEIEKRYYILAKKHLILKRDNLQNEVPGLNMAKINKAYCQMIENLENNKLQQETGISGNEGKDSTFYSLLEKLGMDRQKAENFFYYYKNHIITCLIFFIFFLFIVFPLLKQSQSGDRLNIVFFGHIEHDEDYFKILTKATKDKLENLGEVNIGMILIDDEETITRKISTMLEAYNFIIKGNYDILIMDEDSFREYGVIANIAKLDNIVDELCIRMEDCFSLQLHNDDEEHIYGLNYDLDVIYPEEEDCVNLESNGYSGNDSWVLVAKDEFKDSKLYLEAIKSLINY
jgi:hypothetical protein